MHLAPGPFLAVLLLYPLEVRPLLLTVRTEYFFDGCQQRLTTFLSHCGAKMERLRQMQLFTHNVPSTHQYLRVPLAPHEDRNCYNFANTERCVTLVHLRCNFLNLPQSSK